LIYITDIFVQTLPSPPTPLVYRCWVKPNVAAQLCTCYKPMLTPAALHWITCIGFILHAYRQCANYSAKFYTIPPWCTQFLTQTVIPLQLLWFAITFRGYFAFSMRSTIATA